MMLPGNLRDCVDAYREDLLKIACSRITATQQLWFLHELNLVRGRSTSRQAATSFFNALDPFFGRAERANNLPIGLAVTLPALPITFVKRCPDLTRLASDATAHLSFRLSTYTDHEVHSFGDIALAALLDTQTALSDRDSILQYVAANCSAVIEDYLDGHRDIWDAGPSRHILLPDVAAIRRQQLAEWTAISRLKPADLECFPESAIQSLSIPLMDFRAFALWAPARHFAVCNRCYGRLAFWQRRFTEFEQHAAAKYEYAASA
jgi:hypothetical protein